MADQPSLKDVMDELAKVRKELRGLRATLEAVLSLAVEEVEPAGTPEDLVTGPLKLGTKESGSDRS